MAQEWSRAFYNGRKWKGCKSAFISDRISIDGGLCECCHTEVGYIVHHKIALTPANINNPDISLNFDNLMYVCKNCHDQFEGHGVGKRVKPTCVFDEEGQPVSIRDIDILPPKKI